VAPQSYQQEWMAAGKLHHPNPGWNLHLFWRFTGRLDHGRCWPRWARWSPGTRCCAPRMRSGTGRPYRSCTGRGGRRSTCPTCAGSRTRCAPPSSTGADVLALIDYNARQLTATTVAGLAVDIADLLAAAAADPRVPLPPLGSRPPLTS
jgi:hypothetical protein